MSAPAMVTTSVTGRKRLHHAVEPRALVSAASPGGPRGGYQVAREPDGALQFRDPRGRLLPESPEPVPVVGDPGTSMRARHDVMGLQITAKTGLPCWAGKPLNVGWAISVLHPLAR